MHLGFYFPVPHQRRGAYEASNHLPATKKSDFHFPAALEGALLAEASSGWLSRGSSKACQKESFLKV